MMKCCGIRAWSFMLPVLSIVVTSDLNNQSQVFTSPSTLSLWFFIIEEVCNQGAVDSCFQFVRFCVCMHVSDSNYVLLCFSLISAPAIATKSAKRVISMSNFIQVFITTIHSLSAFTGSIVEHTHIIEKSQLPAAAYKPLFRFKLQWQ